MKIQIITTVNIKVDESQFTDEFMREFRRSFYEFYTAQDHIEHLAWIVSQSGGVPRLIEGYGYIPEDFSLFTDLLVFNLSTQ